MSDFAFLKTESNRYLCGLGPFESSATPPARGEGKIAFYRNNFSLTDPAPWKTPARTFETSDLRDLLPQNGSTPLPEIEWNGLGDGGVREVFDEILAEIEAGELEKTVPVLTERGHLREGEPAALVKALAAAPDEFWGYGFRENGSGLIGLTPERLFIVSADGVLKTMALAGTAPRHEIDDFWEDEKEIREHELVADYLAEKLAGLGEVKRGPRAVLDLGPIVHFLTPLEVNLRDPDIGLDELIKLMHPTPALGAYPRGDGALGRLVEYRERLDVPEDFGAPFGLWHHSKFESVVAIRNVSWSGENVFLPSGVGIVQGSRFDREWRELALKRNSVKALLGV
ncbi:MAG: hypothetical protein HKN23_14620 [Verrucomicrobiales bacterium]|nr:hypothetical protein [Verrucomicrobiales bacterium]